MRTVRRGCPDCQRISGLGRHPALLTVCRERDAGIFVLVKTSNPSSGELQDRRIDGEPGLPPHGRHV